MCIDWINKKPELYVLLPDELRFKWEENLKAGKTPNIGWSHIGPFVRGYDRAKTEGTTEAKANKHDKGASAGPAADDDFALLGPMWRFGEPLPASLPMLVPYFVPAMPMLGFIGAQWGAYKTFVTNDLAAAVACGGQFAGQRVTRRGLVIQIELEGSASKVRVRAAAKKQGAEGNLPIVQLTKIPPPILVGSRVNPSWIQWAGALVRLAKKLSDEMGLPLALITMDPLVYFGGMKDGNNHGEGSLVCRELIALAKDCLCPILVVDHCGKEEARGLIGTSAKEQMAHFMLGMGETVTDIKKPRQLIIRKMKDGEQNRYVDFSVRKVEVSVIEQAEYDNDAAGTVERTHGTLVVDWGDVLKTVGKDDADEEGNLTATEKAYHDVLVELVAQRGTKVPTLDADTRGVRILDWQARLVFLKVLKGDPERTFTRIRRQLALKGKIYTDETWVWLATANEK
jgi:hypothetical protein